MMFLSDALASAGHLLWTLDPRVVAAAVVSLKVALASTVLAAALGVPVGFAVAARNFRGRRALQVTLNTLTALPTVVVGLLAYALLSRRGPLGVWGLLYTQSAMVFGETILVTPLLAALTMGVISGADPRVEQTALTLGASRLAAAFTVLAEMRWGVLVAVAAGFGRLISELGVALMVGGNIQDATRTMTTAIALETSKGDFAFGFALGLILLTLALGVNLGVAIFAPRR
ncbi:MAG: ABC transporter permease [Candidatus Binatia bacterium]|jgi:tungstate transport system permease protein